MAETCFGGLTEAGAGMSDAADGCDPRGSRDLPKGLTGPNGLAPNGCTLCSPDNPGGALLNPPAPTLLPNGCSGRSPPGLAAGGVSCDNAASPVCGWFVAVTGEADEVGGSGAGDRDGCGDGLGCATCLGSAGVGLGVLSTSSSPWSMPWKNILFGAGGVECWGCVAGADSVAAVDKGDPAPLELAGADGC